MLPETPQRSVEMENEIFILMQLSEMHWAGRAKKKFLYSNLNFSTIVSDNTQSPDSWTCAPQ